MSGYRYPWPASALTRDEMAMLYTPDRVRPAAFPSPTDRRSRSCRILPRRRRSVFTPTKEYP
jgi:hypothetical protein